MILFTSFIYLCRPSELSNFAVQEPLWLRFGLVSYCGCRILELVAPLQCRQFPDIVVRHSRNVEGNLQVRILLIHTTTLTMYNKSVADWMPQSEQSTLVQLPPTTWTRVRRVSRFFFLTKSMHKITQRVVHRVCFVSFWG